VRELGHSHAVHWGGEGKYIPSTASLCSSTERECCFSDGVCGGPVRAGPVLCVTVCVSLFVMCEGFVDVEVVFRVPLQVVCILFELFLIYFPISLSVDAVL